MFGSGETFQFASIDVANAEIRKRLRGYIQPDPVGDLKSYVEGSYVTDADLCVAEGHALFDLFQPSLDSPFSEEMEGAIENSRKMLDLAIDPDAGIDSKYLEETWKRATRLLRELAALFWENNSSQLAVPAIAPAETGSIDLFWERRDLTLLINIPADDSQNVTFYGRRQSGKTKISGSLAPSDRKVQHLSGWLSDRE